jgi:hypothetical protein
MSLRLHAVVRRLVRGTAGCLLGGAMMVPLGPTTTSQAVSQINATSMRPLPSVATRPVVREEMIWVPDRIVPVFGEPTGALVPGHWERRLPGSNDVLVPPLTILKPSTGTFQTLPAAVRPPPDERLGP